MTIESRIAWTIGISATVASMVLSERKLHGGLSRTQWAAAIGLLVVLNVNVWTT